MTSRAKPPGFTNNVTLPKSAQVEIIDANQASNVDGDAGGTYTPTVAMRIEGAGLGSDGLLASTITGTLQRVSTGRWQPAVDTTTIVVGDGATPQILDMSADIYLTTIDHAAQNVIIHLADTVTGELPGTGDVIEVVRIGVPSAAKSFEIFAESAPAARIGAFPQTWPAGGNQLHKVYSAKYWYDGATWQPLRFSSDVSF